MVVIGLLNISLITQVRVSIRAKIDLEGQSQDILAGVINKQESQNRTEELMLKVGRAPTKGWTSSIKQA